MPVMLRNEDHAILMSMIDASNQIDHLPAHVYKIAVTTKEIALIKDRKQFDLPAKIFGDLMDYKNQIMQTFEENKNESLGVLLTGLKGSGKSLTAEMLANAFLIRDFPVFIIDSPIPADLIRMVAKLGPCMIYFDEFGKVYNQGTKSGPRPMGGNEQPDHTESLLTLFSDTSLQNVMFVVTANSTNEFSDFMLNRPGRFYYRINYSTLSDKVVTEVLKEYKVPDTHTTFFLNYVKYSHGPVSMDILRVIAKEAVKSSDTMSFVKRLSLMNVPEPIHPKFEITHVFYKGEDITPTSRCRVNNYKDLTVNIDKDGNPNFYKREFDINTLVDMYGLKTGEVYDIDLLDGVKLRFGVVFNSHYAGGNYAYTALETAVEQEENRRYAELHRIKHQEWANTQASGRITHPAALGAPMTAQ